MDYHEKYNNMIVQSLYCLDTVKTEEIELSTTWVMLILILQSCIHQMQFVEYIIVC